MIVKRPSSERGHAEHGWLDTYHTFSFADYYDPKHMGFRTLRVINEDVVEPGNGFPMHSHRDMEIVTFILEGALEHEDSMGNKSVIRPGDAQRMSAGTGVTHSESNPSKTERVHLLQIWIVPKKRGLEPSYEQKAFPESARRGQLRLLASPTGRDGAVTIQQDVELSTAILDHGQTVTHDLAAGRHAWLQVTRGGVDLNGMSLKAGDGAAVSDERSLQIRAADGAEVLLFDLA
ncbi:MAG: pirin family protein [Planctomycetes bacterium]|nr:pirin family protein [Planctomycetota bacterium]